MKKLILLLSVVCLSLVSNAQKDIDKSKINPAYLQFLPSSAKPEDLRPSDIPSQQVLKQMGFSDKEIAEAMDFKYSRGKYAKSAQDTSTSATDLSKFYKNLGDTLLNDTATYPKARIFGQDIFRNNTLQFYQKTMDAKAPENYKVGSGDEISISVWGYSEFSENLMVDQQGYITPSSYGRIYVKGLTFEKMRSLIKSKFSSFLDMKNSEIDVTLSYSRVITVNIVGEVYHPGSYTISAINTAFNALVAAKGPNQLGTVRNIYIKRDGKTVDSLDVYRFLFDPAKSQDIFLQDGDYIFVPPAKNIVEVKGAVNRPYTYEAKSGESVANILKYAGGFTTHAFRDVITLKRIEYNTVKVNDVYKDHLTNTGVKHGDELVVNTISNRLSGVVSIQGSIGVAGDYQYVKGERLLTLLERAKCIDERTFLDKVYVIRLNADRTKSHLAVNLKAILADNLHEDNILLQEYDIVKVLAVDDFDDELKVTVFGSVRQPGEFNFGVGMTLQDVLLQAGGLTQQAEGSRVEVSRIMDYDMSTKKLKPKRTVVKTISVGDNLLISEESNDFVLQPFDQIFVRENPNFEAPINVTLVGEVKFPGIYTLLSKDEDVASVISRAGGFSKYAFLDGTQMYRKFEVKKMKSDSKIVMPFDLNDTMVNPLLLDWYTKELEKETVFDTDEKIYMYDMVYLDLEKAMNSKNSKHNLVMIDGDSIIIPKTLDLVHITGELEHLEGNSISAPYFTRKRANYYVNNFAGGFSKENDKSNTVVVFPNGVSKKSKDYWLFSVSPIVKRGSTIVVSGKSLEEKKKESIPIDWNQQIENTTLKISAILTLWLLIERVNAQ